MEIKINRTDCIACGLCQVYAPDVFDYDDEGIVRFSHQEPDLDRLDCERTEGLVLALKKCPTAAIKIEYKT